MNKAQRDDFDRMAELGQDMECFGAPAPKRAKRPKSPKLTIEASEYTRSDGLQAMTAPKAKGMWLIRKIEGFALFIDPVTKEWYPAHAVKVDSLAMPFETAMKLLKNLPPLK